ncbi:MAG: protein kinase domain-containing protein [Polyangiaceae bacterium]|jgi:eukaryotic-like serine/threonine-protein kinase
MAAVQQDNKIEAGTLLVGKYKVTGELGRGGMAAVYDAEHVNIGKRVAVKVLSADLTNSTVVIERFFREARAAASVRSPYIVEVYDSGRLEDGRPFIVMELLEGESLYDRMARVRLIDTGTTVRIISQVAKGLIKAHGAGIVHRDLKPENIHLCKVEDGGEIAKILDFGLAKFYAPVEADEKTARLTREGAVFGTPAYMSPEQVKGHGNVDHRADLWALGCMAFECLTGRPVWNTDQGVAMTFAAIAAGVLPVPSRLRPELPTAFDTWFSKALERDPNNRFQTASDLAAGLAIALDAPPISLVTVGGMTSQIELEAIAGLQEAQGPPPPSSGVKKAFGDLGGTQPTSEPLDLPIGQGPALSATDLPPTAAPEGAPTISFERGRSGVGPALFSVFLLAVAGAAAWFAYVKVLHPKVSVPVSAANFPASSVPSASSEPAAPPPPELPKWMTPVEEGQQLLASGDADGALRKFKEASDSGGGVIAKSFLEQVKLGSSTTGPCKMVAFSHPRLGYGGNLGRPTVAVTSKGDVVAWTDDHEQPGHDHVYSVLIDAAGRPTSRPRDLTPEADYAMRPSLLSAGDRVALLFWDKGGRDPGVKVRWLDADGRIDGMSVSVGAARAGLFWPAIDRSADGSGFWVVWQASRDKEEGDDIFLRRLDAELQPQGSEVRASDYELDKGKSAKPSSPTIGLSGSNLFVAYALERDRQHLVERLRVPLASSDLQAALQAQKVPHEIGDTAVMNEDKVGGDYPSLACAKDACFLVWHEIDRGAQAALIDPSKATLLWRKRFAPRGGHPAVAITQEGQAEVVFYEAGRVRVAAISRDGVGTTSTFAKVAGDEPRPWIAPGRVRGEWLVAWLDAEATHTETFVARLQCRN